MSRCHQTVYSYSIFFILVWFMWAQQIIYHTRFYTDDVYHRIILVIQFMLFGEIPLSSPVFRY